MIFKDRTDAGKQLAKALKKEAGLTDAAVFALPRGGVVVGKEVADALGLPLHLFVTRKIGSPWNPEYAVGALAETGEIIWGEEEEPVIESPAVKAIVKKEKNEAKRRIKVYRGGAALPDLTDKTAIIVDDGVATGGGGKTSERETNYYRGSARRQGFFEPVARGSRCGYLAF